MRNSFCQKNFQKLIPTKFHYIFLFVSQSINRHRLLANVRQLSESDAILCLNSRALPLRFICYFTIFCSLFNRIFYGIFPRKQNYRVRRRFRSHKDQRKNSKLKDMRNYRAVKGEVPVIENLQHRQCW